jgi:chromosome segregation ATPase
MNSFEYQRRRNELINQINRNAQLQTEAANAAANYRNRIAAVEGERAGIQAEIGNHEKRLRATEEAIDKHGNAVLQLKDANRRFGEEIANRIGKIGQIEVLSGSIKVGREYALAMRRQLTGKSFSQIDTDVSSGVATVIAKYDSLNEEAINLRRKLENLRNQLSSAKRQIADLQNLKNNAEASEKNYRDTIAQLRRRLYELDCMPIES